MDPDSTTDRERSPGRPPPTVREFLVWFACVYFVLYALPFPASYLPTWRVWNARLGEPEVPAKAESALELWDEGVSWAPFHVQKEWREIVPWVGKEVFHTEVGLQPSGSGDKTFDYIQNMLCVLAAVLLGGLLAAATRRGPPRWLRFGLLVGARYYVAFASISYGFFKVVKSQFPDPSLSRLIQPYGESSPMGIVWTFMGVSGPYNWFAGGCEILGGALLLFRRTSTLGALVTMAVMANVAMLNFAYDVPVKLYSGNLLVIAAVIASADAGRLWRFFVRNERAEPRDLAPPIRSRVLRALGFAFKWILIVHVVWGDVDMTRGSYRMRDGRARPELYGIWDVTSFERDGWEIPPLTTDGTRWKRLIHDFPGYDGKQYVTVESMDGERRTFLLEEDPRITAAFANLVCCGPDEPDPRGIRLTPPGSAEGERLVLRRPTDGELVLTGELDGLTVDIHLTRRLPEDFLLMNRGYHWINERPFNR